LIADTTGAQVSEVDQAQLDDLWLTIHRMQPAAPILDLKDPASPSVFLPETMMREARRLKCLSHELVPPVCILDPDGDLLRQLQAEGVTVPCKGWACFHTVLYEFTHAGQRFGIVGCAVGGAFSVLIAEQAFVSGCQLLISISSAGQIIAPERAPYFILIERALRDEGTSYHYVASSRYIEADPAITRPVFAALHAGGRYVHLGASWTTDAPFRETEQAIAAAKREGILAVEMEAAALYAFAKARCKKVLCFAHVTNQMRRIHGDFEKGDANGAHAALDVIVIAARAVMEGPA
jgi:uridine phosphorylase